MPDDKLFNEQLANGDTRSVWLERTSDGGISITGQDLGDSCGFFGSEFREYEWAHSVGASDIPALIRSLGGAADSDVRELVARRFAGAKHDEFASFCAEANIAVSFWSRSGE